MVSDVNVSAFWHGIVPRRQTADPDGYEYNVYSKVALAVTEIKSISRGLCNSAHLDPGPSSGDAAIPRGHRLAGLGCARR